jgi:hypothetical protein
MCELVNVTKEVQTNQGRINMHRWMTFLLLSSLFLFSCNSTPKSGPPVKDRANTVLPPELQGVWAGYNCELVQTGEFALLFERMTDTLIATLYNFSLSGDSLICDMRGQVILDTLSRLVAIKAKDLLDGGEIIADLDSTNTVSLSARTCELTKPENEILVEAGGDVVERLDLLDYGLRFVTTAGRSYGMEQIEKIAVVKPYRMPSASKNNIARCLQEWELGTRAMKEQKHVVGLPINTNEHSYIFYFGGMIYCRAARIHSDDNGTVFDQNIRMMWKPGEFTAAMSDSNLTESGAPVNIQDTLFNPKACVYGADGIYWSLKSVTDTLIVINGCGQDYFRRPPAESDSSVVEWIAYERYDVE